MKFTPRTRSSSIGFLALWAFYCCVSYCVSSILLDQNPGSDTIARSGLQEVVARRPHADTRQALCDMRQG